MTSPPPVGAESSEEVARRLPEHAGGWLEDLAMCASEEGKRDGWRAYRMSYDGEVSCGVIDCSRHGGGHLLDTDKTKALLDLGLMKTVWPCDNGYVPDWFFAESDDDDEVFECTSYCGECEPELVITPLGARVAAHLKAQEEKI